MHKQSIPLNILLLSQRSVTTAIMNKDIERSVRNQLDILHQKLLLWKIELKNCNPMKILDENSARHNSYVAHLKLNIQYYFTFICVCRISFEESLMKINTGIWLDEFLKDSDTATDLIEEALKINSTMTPGHLVFIYTLGLVRSVLEQTVQTNNRMPVYMQALKKLEDNYGIPRGKYTNPISKSYENASACKAKLFKYLSEIEDLY